jgi:Na+/H+-dicarboxylate symporter
MQSGTRVVVALVAGLAVGVGIAASGNSALMRGAEFLAPVGTLWVNAIRMTVIPLVVSLIVVSIASVSDLRTIGRLGGRSLMVFGAMLVGLALIAVPTLPRIFAMMPGAGGGKAALPPGAAEAAGEIAASGQAPTFAGWLVSLIPPNPIAAAANGAMLPLLVFTMLFAFAVSRSPSGARETMVNFFKGLSEVMLVLVRGVIALAPIGIFALVTALAARTGVSMAGAIGFFIIAYAIAHIGAILLVYPAVALAGVPIRQFARAVLPSQLIALTSSSSIASLPALVEGAERGLEIPERTTGFVLPLAVSIFKFAGPVSWTMGAAFVAAFYGIALDAKDLLVIGLAAIFLAFGAPGIPRGAFLMLAPLFAAIGLPIEGIGLLIAVDAIPDMFATTLNVTGDMGAVALVDRWERSGGQV